MFDFYKINFPVLILRNSVLLTDATMTSKMNKLDVTVADLMQPEDTMIKNYISKKSGASISLQKEVNEVENIFENIKQKADQHDPPLLASIEGEKHKVLNSLKNLETKLTRAEKKKEEININQLKKLREKILPANSFQERYENVIPFYLKYGDDFFKSLKENLDPFDFRLVVLED